MKLTKLTKNRGRLQVYESLWAIDVLMDREKPAAGTYCGQFSKFSSKVRKKLQRPTNNFL